MDLSWDSLGGPHPQIVTKQKGNKVARVRYQVRLEERPGCLLSDPRFSGAVEPRSQNTTMEIHGMLETRLEGRVLVLQRWVMD